MQCAIDHVFRKQIHPQRGIGGGVPVAQQRTSPRLPATTLAITPLITRTRRHEALHSDLPTISDRGIWYVSATPGA